MARYPARVIESGRVTIPHDIREDLGIGKGDTVLVNVETIPGVEGG